jgi:hypothetical protein
MTLFQSKIIITSSGVKASVHLFIIIISMSDGKTGSIQFFDLLQTSSAVLLQHMLLYLLFLPTSRLMLSLQ